MLETKGVRALVRRASSAFLFLVAGVLSLGSLAAQTNQGALAGVIYDPGGALVSGAQIVATNAATGTSQETVSGSDGGYRFPALLVGRYNVKVSAPGFQTLTQQGIDVQISSTSGANFTLQVGNVSESVTVSAEGTAVQSESSDIGTVIDNKQEVELPLALGGVGAFRSPEAFMFLAPGVTGPGTSNSNNGVFVSKIGAGQNFGNEVLLDGSDIERTENGSSFDEAAPSVEAIREFRVITSTLPSEYGRTTGGIESFATRNGTNEFHGTAYDIFRNEDLDANGWFANHYLTTCAPGDSACRDLYQRPLDRKNDYGLNLGGPVWIPKVYNGRNKLFFFFNWEQYQQNQGASITSTVPTAAERSGNFSALLNTGNVVGTNPCDGSPIYAGEIFDPNTTRVGAGGIQCRSPFPGNIIPADRFSAVSKNVLNYIPAAQNGASVNNFTLASAFPLYNTAYEIRIDESLSEHDKIFVSYHSRENGRYASAAQLPAPVDPSGWNQDFITHYARVGWDHVFSPTLLNELNLGYNRTNSQNYNTSAEQAKGQGFSWATKLGISNDSGQNFPIVTFGEGFPNLSSGHNDDNVDNGERLTDQVTWTHGKHSISFGGDARNQLYSTFGYDNDGGTFNFARAETAGTANTNATSGNGFASFLLGLPDTGTLEYTLHVARWVSQYYAVFIKDDWKARPNLTLNLGLRWDLDQPRRESYNDTSNFSPTTPNPGAAGYPGAVVYGTTCNCNARWANTYYKDFGPRIGFAWSPTRFNDRLVVRGGYGIYYSPLIYTDFGGDQQAGYTSTPSFHNGDNFTPAFNWDNGFPAFDKSPNTDPTALNGTNGSSGLDYIKPTYGRPGMIQNWSLQVQKQLGADMIGTVAYVGMRSTHLRSAIQNVNNIPIQDFALGNQLEQDVNGNTAGVPIPYAGFQGQVQQALRPFPQYQWIYADVLQNDGQASYEALQATLERRFTKGLSVQASFTWQKTMTDADSALPGVGQVVNQVESPGNLNLEKAVSSQDVPFMFTAAYLYELPFGRGKRLFSSGLGNVVLGGWEIGGVQRYQSGIPVSFGCASGIPGWDNCIRFSRVLGQSLYSSAVENNSFDPFVNSYWNPAAFVDANATRTGNQAFVLGTMPRVSDDARMQAYQNEDFSIIRNFHVKEQISLQFKAELLNAFNRHIWSLPDNGPYSPTFGLVTGTVDAPRSVQFTLRMNF